MSSVVSEANVGRSLGRMASAPELPRNYLPRTDLWRRLDRADQGSATVLVAPAGAGKTLAAAGWLRDRFPADTTGAIPAALWLEGSQGWSQQALAGVLDRAAAYPPEPDQVEVTGPGSRLVVIDDAHLLPVDTVRMIERRLARDPGNLRLLLLSRWALLQSSLTAELLGELTIIRGRDLRLTADEARSLVRQHVGRQGPEVVEAIVTRAGGWCAATVLAARAVAASADPVDAARRFAEGSAGFADRVMSEVFAALPSRQRHLLLCVANEEYVTGETARVLTRDPDAAGVLTELADSGLLVTRVADTSAKSVVAEAYSGDDTATYRIQPLLAEVVRRRLAARGVDTEQARATVMLAVELDIANGRVGKAFDRMAAMGGTTQALELLGAHGQSMIFRGQGTTIAQFVREHPDLMEADRRAWMPVAVEYWLSGDINQACYWLDRRAASGLEKLDPVDNACAALMRARLGLEPVDEAVAHAQQLTRNAGAALAGKSVAGFAHLLVELGATENWTGQLAEAEQSLMAAIGLAEAHGLELISAMGASTLAYTKYMSGHEHAGGVLATQALDTLARLPRRLGQFTAASAALAAMLARLVEAPWLAPEQFDWTPRALHPADLCGRYWVRSGLSQLRIRDDSLSAAEQAIDVPLELPVVDELPPHLHIASILERAGLATLSGNEELLRTSAVRLRELDCVGGALLVEGSAADLAGDSRRAIELFGSAAEALRGASLALRSFALTCRSQLLDALGEQEDALLGIREAVSETAVSRNAMSFLGWTRYGTPMQTLLGRLAGASDGPWTTHIVGGMAGRVDLTSAFLSTAPTARERASAGSTLVRPKLSPRELDVLRGLARGSTYSDIGAELFLSENTIKTHVSNLYAKLGVSRRSDALSVGRGLNLL